MDAEQLRQPTMRKLSVLERNRAALEFLKMNERPDDYILHNRYLDRAKMPARGKAGEAAGKAERVKQNWKIAKSQTPKK